MTFQTRLFACRRPSVVAGSYPGRRRRGRRVPCATAALAALAAVELASAQEAGPETVTVEGAQLSWAYTAYAQTGVLGAWRQWTEGPDVGLRLSDGATFTTPTRS